MSRKQRWKAKQKKLDLQVDYSGIDAYYRGMRAETIKWLNEHGPKSFNLPNLNFSEDPQKTPRR